MINPNVPNVADVVGGWLTDLDAEYVTKTIIDGDVEEKTTPISMRGMVQVLKPTEVALKPEGERSWDWCAIYTDYAKFDNDDRIKIGGVYFRIMGKRFWQDLDYGFYAYEAIRDYQ